MTSIRAIVGECTGKVRSTPIPKDIFRTVNVSRSPPPWRRITTPWKTWMRSRPASATRTCTRTVSPGLKSGRSSRKRGRSTRSVLFMAGSRVREGASADAHVSTGLSATDASRAGSVAVEEVGAVAPGLLGGGAFPPPGDPRVVAGQQDVGDLHAAELPGARVVRVIESAVREGLRPQRLLVTDDAG